MARKNASERLDDVEDKLSTIIEKLSRLESAEASEPWHTDEALGLTLAEWAPEAFHVPGIIGGIVVDAGLARETECKIVPLGNNELWYSKGVVGALDEEQKKLFCLTGTSQVNLPPELALRQSKVREIAVACQTDVQSIPEGERLTPFLKCMAITASEKGIQI